MKTDAKGTVRRWLEALRSVGFLLAFVFGACLVGFCISWPLWIFSTQAPRVYTITILSLIGAGIVALFVRAGVRKRGAVEEDLSKPRRTFLAVLLTFIMVCVGIVGAFGAVASLARHLWLWGVLNVLLWVAVLWLLGRVRRSVKTRKAAAIHAENLK